MIRLTRWWKTLRRVKWRNDSWVFWAKRNSIYMRAKSGSSSFAKTRLLISSSWSWPIVPAMSLRGIQTTPLCKAIMTTTVTETVVLLQTASLYAAVTERTRHQALYWQVLSLRFPNIEPQTSWSIYHQIDDRGTTRNLPYLCVCLETWIDVLNVHVKYLLFV